MIRFFRLNVPQVRVLLSFVLAIAFTLPTYAQEPDVDKGKSLFNMNCAACHKLNKRAVGPALAGVSQKYEKEWLYSWIKNSMAMVKSGDPQAVAIYEEYNKSVMTAFPQLSNEDIDNILAYTDYTPPAPAVPVAVATTAASGGDNTSSTLLLGVLVLVLVILVVMLFLVTKTLRKIAVAKWDRSPKNQTKTQTALGSLYQQFLLGV
jgi:mono/diheme cytochrome c family protein